VELVAASILSNLVLVHEQLLGVVDDEPKPARVLLLRDNLLVLVTLAVKIRSIRFFIRIVTRPDDAGLVVNALRTQGKLKGADEVVLEE